MYQISREDLLASIQKINREHPLLIVAGDESNFLYQYSAKNEWNMENFVFPPIRTSQPMKSFYFPVIQKTASYPLAKSAKSTKRKEELVIFGPKACDINALKIIDAVYADGDFPDNTYIAAREKNIIISGDCLKAGDNCFCSLFNAQPFPEKDFDLNLSEIESEFVIEIGSPKGEKFLKTYFSDYNEAAPELLQKRDAQRNDVVLALEKQNADYKYFQSHQASIKKHLTSNAWGDLSKTCVECGICTQICPTCHCFQLFDMPEDERYNRIRVWDSCFFGGYSRMAGGLTPRLKLEDRFKNRFYHKFDSFVTNFKMEACTGCGRCVEGCMGNIDLREVLLELEKRVVLKDNLDLQ